MRIRECLDGVWAVRLGPVHAYLIAAGDGLVLVDAGPPGSRPALLRAIRATGHRPDHLRTILITHAHPDHIGSVAELRRITGATVVAHRTEAPVLTGERSGVLHPVMRAVAAVLPSPGSFSVDVTIDAPNGVCGPVPTPEMFAVPAPGHTAGHTAYLLDRDGGVLFTGDAAVLRYGRPAAPRRILDEDRAAARESLRALGALPFAHCCFGHGGHHRGPVAEAFRRFAAGHETPRE